MRLKSACRLWWISVPAVAADRISKLTARRALAPRGVKSAVPGILSWAYTENTGAAFSMLRGRGLFLVALTLLLVAALLVYLLRHPENDTAERAGLWLIIGGGLGNLWDRLFYGGVIDFIRLDFISFPIFNIADICVCCGAALVILSLFTAELRRKKHG